MLVTHFISGIAPKPHVTFPKQDTCKIALQEYFCIVTLTRALSKKECQGLLKFLEDYKIVK